MLNKIRIIKGKFNIALAIKAIPKTQIAFGALIVLFIAFFLYHYLIQGQLQRLKATEVKLSAKKSVLDFYGRLTKEEKEKINKTEQKDDGATKIREMFIPEEELSGYFTNFRALVKSHNLEILSLDLKPADTESVQYEYFQKLAFNVSIKGNNFNVMSLLGELEKNKPVLDIKSVRIYKDSQDDYTVVLDILASVYILKKSI